jgi:MGT family glycosyltransferase
MQHMYGAAPREAVLDGLLGFSRYCETAAGLRRRTAATSPGIVDYLGNPQALNIVFTSRAFQVGGELFDDRYVFVGPDVPGAAAAPAVVPAPASTDTPASSAAGGDARRPVIYISMGTMYNDEAGLYRACFEAFGNQPCEVVMAVGHRVDRDALRDVPSNIAVHEYVAQVDVLQRADLFVTHGGINSAHEAMLCGVPMIVLPRAADHYIVAERVAAVGAGMVLNRAQATPARLVELMERVLAEPAYRTRAAAVGETLRAAGGARRAVDAIEQFTAGQMTAGQVASGRFTGEGY